MTPRGVLLVLLMLSAAGAYVCAGYVLNAAATPLAFESSLEAAGHRVRRATGSAIVDVLAADEPPTWIVLLDPHEPFGSERETLSTYVEAGGTLWIVTRSPVVAAPWDPQHESADPYPGLLYASDGGPATLRTRGGVPSDGAGVAALRLVAQDGLAPVLTADADAFRDTNANGRLDEGEPGGPFVVGAERLMGDGRVLLLAMRPESALAPEVINDLAPALDADVLIVRRGAAPAAWAPVEPLATLSGLPLARDPLALTALLAFAGAAYLLIPRAPPEGGDDGAELSRLVDDYVRATQPRSKSHDRREP